MKNVLAIEYVENRGGPCSECFVRPKCLNKSWRKLIRGCYLLTNHMIETSGIWDAPKGSAISYEYNPLKKRFRISKTIDGRVLFGNGRHDYE